MKEEEKNKSLIIIKRPKKGGHSAHGGAWKVALADFMTSLSMFFIVMWIINMLTPAQKEGVAAYFRNFTIFENYPKGSLIETQPWPGKTKEEEQEKKKEEEREKKKEIEVVKEELEKKIGKELSAGLAGQLMVNTFEKGIKIQLVESKTVPMFPSGSPELTPEAKGILKMIAKNIKGAGHKIVIEGHTDSQQYGSSEYTNWELSTERATRARRELESNGVDPKQFAQVTGYADTQLLVKNNPHDPKNRRISVLLYLK